ncbi:iron-sulfur cluster assembly accessory protein [Salipaludibacillus agaradhaerens]|uniref:HesB/IscA family protein n=1 Tax=Salipaludibacillus agaradhaerens TaxID=76935 RepID=UPI002151C2C5|nr:iron-sulfur cluster assembly accessory protein [Salipaludibacillus agaradhaerens]MCR6107827.1 iron-sulfur cluster assembly accessory protein [Salipaludibacillus agaradhaerens]MCR6119856.1 iron-sulfur cluster assembly accessory protein [Salipaludibacillus agaradhaerens]UJW58904.1 iron-sulfur cluster assembly accessory protein [Bacillus sp. A116_S68]
MLTITEAAVGQVKAMMADDDDAKYLRIGVQGGGCSGLSYVMGFDTEINEEDKHLEIEGLEVVVEKENIPMLEGVKIDYKQNMMGGGFTIDNPNAIANCGCGSSFRTATNEGTPEEC